jgi:hypothetical protein
LSGFGRQGFGRTAVVVEGVGVGVGAGVKTGTRIVSAMRSSSTWSILVAKLAIAFACWAARSAIWRA